MLSIYNTLTRRKDDFVPIQPGTVRMYVCGMTVYDFCHLGHARVMVVFDMVSRWLRASGYDVTYVRNITDIDDKIIKRANENGETINALTRRYIDFMNEDSDALGIIRPDIEPRATDHVQGMLDMIAKLIEKGHAYQAANGDVFYSVRSFAPYGKLSGKSLEDLRAGERVEVDNFKKDPMDFVLWKSVKPGEPSWDSPWGAGRPGWHIECSAMSKSLLGERFDIHGGGADLQFPHHENEIAQSEGALCGGAGCGCDADDKPNGFVRYWMHNGFIRVDNEKMSKSLGNFFTIRDVLQEYDAEVVRFFILRAQYRSPLNYSVDTLNDARAALARLYTALKPFDSLTAGPIDWSEPHATAFKAAMDDDFNTPVAVSVLFELANHVNKTADAAAAQLLKSLAGVLGLLERSASEFLQAGGQANDIDVAQIEALIEQRKAAKAAKDFAQADAIRAQLTEMGIAIEDKAGGVVEWRRL